jgi:hypothetical protein
MPTSHPQLPGCEVGMWGERASRPEKEKKKERETEKRIKRKKRRMNR